MHQQGHEKKMGGLQVADKRKMFTMKCPCDGKRCESESSHLFSPAALCWSRVLPSQTPWTRRLCWSQAAPRESASAWLSGWPLTLTKHLKVTRDRQSFYCISFKLKHLAGSVWDRVCAAWAVYDTVSLMCVSLFYIYFEISHKLPLSV